MGVLFISHSSQDNDQAVRVRDWLKSQGWGEVFLDLDPAQGLAPGQRWQEELKRAGENCAAVVVLVSPNWVASRWCQTEFLVADQLGKRVFPVFIAPTPFDDLPLELKGKFQLADISTPEKEAEGFQRLAHGLKRAGLDPTSFHWPPPGEPTRSVYRGLQALDVQDAAIFFGRDAAITKGLDELRRLRDGAPELLLVILGASGAGKSSFLRAGLMARLKRDEQNFLVLPIVRPERAAMSGAQGLIASLRTAGFQPADSGNAGQMPAAQLAQAFAELRRPVVERLTRNAEAARETYSAKPPTIIIPIDQAEELFGAEQAERVVFCEALAGAIAQDGNALVVATIRSDSYEPLQTESLLASAPQLLFNLPPIAAGSFQQIIEGPARLAKPPLAVEPALTQQLLADLDAADALPLLAFTLERLKAQHGGDAKLTLADYHDKLGGLSGAIQTAVAAVLGAQPSKDELAQARRLFVPALVQVDRDGVKRRVGRRANLPADTQALADRFVEQRLLVTDDGSIEVAHEAILRQWPALASWIAEERLALSTLEAVSAAWREWRDHFVRRGGREGESWLAHRGDRLREALEIARREDVGSWIEPDVLMYLDECAQAEGRRKRQSIRMQVLGASALVLVISAGLAFMTQDQWRPELDAWWNYKRFVHSAEELRAGPTGEESAFQDCRPGSCPLMVVIPEGSAMIGAAADDPEVGGYSLPLQQVTMPRFAVSQHEITWADWQPCVAARRCPELDRSGWDGDDRPVINASWLHAQAYADWVKEMTGQDYRLLTEQEWEYAARGVTSAEATPTRFSWGDEDPVCDTAAENGAAFRVCEQQTTWPAGSFKVNAFGLYDMHGNVWEWTATCFDAEQSFEQTEAETSECSSRVVRGGSWLNEDPQYLRSANSSRNTPSVRFFHLGFRVARTL